MTVKDIVNEQQEGNSMEHDSVESEGDGDVPDETPAGGW